MRQKIRKAVAALSRGQLLRIDNSVPILFREETIDPFTIGVCCTDESGTGPGCFGQSGVSFGYCCSVSGDFTPGVTLEGDVGSTGFTCCPEPPTDPLGQCCGDCESSEKKGVDLGLKTESDCIASGGTWRGVNGQCDSCDVRCCLPCEGFPDLFGECTQITSSDDCDGKASPDTDCPCPDECPPEGSGCCCFINDDGEVVSETLIGSDGANICAARGGIFTAGFHCDLVDCGQFNVCCDCSFSDCRQTSVSNPDGNDCTITLEPSVNCSPVLVDGECGTDQGTAPDGDCTECGTDTTNPDAPGPCGCPCEGFVIDSSQCGFPPLCQTCGSCGLTVVVGDLRGCASGSFECECIDVNDPSLGLDCERGNIP